ncbi:MAG: BMP family ABC transporter substrate-binding protein [Acidimicrobiales bacterium]|nr:BMP family ABC transporter substrate-binding protein [Acidimicrobiales bacterium]
MTRSTTGRRPWLLPFVLLSALALLLGACGSDDDSSDSDTTEAGATDGADGDVVKAGFIYIGPVNDGGWTQAHDEGREAAAAALEGEAELIYKENIPEGPEATQAMQTMIDDGVKIIFANSFGYGDAMKELAAENPDVKFEHATGAGTLDNFATYYGAAEDTIYLTGIAAGAAIPEGGTVGFVAPFPIPEVIRHINAFQIGVAEVNPTATTKVVWTNTWFDPTVERQAADSLIADGVDAIASGQDSPASGEAAKAADLPFVGYDSDQSENLGDIWLTASLYHWGDYYTERIQAVIDGTWETHEYWGGIHDGFVSLAPFGPTVTQETKDLIATRQQELVDGDFYELTGPLVDQDGTERVADGVKMTLPEILAMDWFVEGVVGNPSA